MAIDILYDEDGDILIQDGDIMFGEADDQCIQTLLLLNPGELKHSPLTGCEIIRLTNARVQQTVVERDIKLQFKADGWKDVKVKYAGEELTVGATRK